MVTHTSLTNYLYLTIGKTWRGDSRGGPPSRIANGTHIVIKLNAKSRPRILDINLIKAGALEARGVLDLGHLGGVRKDQTGVFLHPGGVQSSLLDRQVTISGSN